MSNQHHLNGNSNRKDPFNPKNEDLKFPVKYPLKAIFVQPERENNYKSQLKNTFEILKVKYHLLDRKLSKKGNYISFTFEVFIENRTQMNELYEALREMDGLKFAL